MPIPIVPALPWLAGSALVGALTGYLRAERGYLDNELRRLRAKLDNPDALSDVALAQMETELEQLREKHQAELHSLRQEFQLAMQKLPVVESSPAVAPNSTAVDTGKVSLLRRLLESNLKLRRS